MDNPYVYFFCKYFNGYAVIFLIVLFCYFIRQRNLYIFENYKNNINKIKRKKREIQKKREVKEINLKM